MKKLAFIALLSIAVLCPLAANQLLGFGFTYGWDITHSAFTLDIPLLGSITTDSYNALSGIGFNGDVYLGQKVGFYAGGAFGLLTNQTIKTVSDDTTNTDSLGMSDYEIALFGEVMAGLGMFLPVMNNFDLSLGFGPGIMWTALRPDGSDSTANSQVLGVGASAALGMPVGTSTEIYASVRAIYGFLDLSDPEIAYFVDSLSITPALGVRIKL